jgi:DNA-binding MarR family transcriptional regulator
MTHWADELHAVFLQISGFINRPDIDVAFLRRADVKLDRALFPLLSRIGLNTPIGVVELGNLVGRDHSTISRQVAKLEALGLIERYLDPADQRIRLLHPTVAGYKMLRHFRQARRNLMAENFSDWSQADLDTLVTLLQRMSNRMQEMRN